MITQIKQLQNNWGTTLPRFSEREWLKVFPQAELRVRELIAELQKEAEELSLRIYRSFKKIYQLANKNSFWFWEEVVKVFQGEELIEKEKRIRELKWALKKENNSNDITDGMIQRAKEYPFDRLVEAKRNFAVCPFHSEKYPSFYIKNNFGYCFGCSWQGDTIKFVMEKNGLNFKEAVKFLN